MKETHEQAIHETEQELFKLTEACDKAQQAYWDAYDRKVECRRRLMDLRRVAQEKEVSQ